MKCKNCHTELQEQDDYCKSCGAKVIRNRLTIKNLFSHFSETYFNIDNTFLKTFKTLFTAPEKVIGSYIDGTRKKYLNAINYFALAITITGLYIFIIKKFFPNALDMSIYTEPVQKDMQRGIQDFVTEYNALFMMLYVPLYALIAKITFYDIKKYNYTEYLVIFIYIQAQISITSAVLVVLLVSLSVPATVVSFGIIPLMIFYSAYCLKRTLNLTNGNMLVKTMIFFAILGVLFIISTVVMAIVMYTNGTFDQMIEAKKASIEAQRALKDSLN